MQNIDYIIIEFLYARNIITCPYGAIKNFTEELIS